MKHGPLYDYSIGFLHGGYRLYPLGEIISGGKYPRINIAQVILELTDEIKPPLLERGLDHYWLQGKRFHLLLPNEQPTLGANSDRLVHI